MPAYTSRELNFETCTFAFVVFSHDVQKAALIAQLRRIFNFNVLEVEVVASQGHVQYTVKLNAVFFRAALLAISHLDAIWSRVQTLAQQNPTLYISLVRYFFCDTTEQIARNMHAGNMHAAACYMPMDRMTSIGECLSVVCLCLCVCLFACRFSTLKPTPKNQKPRNPHKTPQTQQTQTASLQLRWIARSILISTRCVQRLRSTSKAYSTSLQTLHLAPLR